MCGGDSLSEVMAFAFGPISGVPWKIQKVIEEFWDIVNNGYLDKKVKKERNRHGSGKQICFRGYTSTGS